VIAIVAAMPEELAAVRRMLEGSRDLASGRVRASQGRIAGRDVVLAIAGDGATRATSMLTALHAEIPCSATIGIGVAGGLTGDLAAGRLVAADAVFDALGASLLPDGTWLDAAIRAGATRSHIVSTASIVATPSAKRSLARSVGAASAAVDLESYAWAGASASRGIPWTILRVIGDGVDEAIPEFIARCQREDGSMDRGRVAARGLAVPTRWTTLLRLRRRVHEASAILAAALATILADAPRGISVGNAVTFVEAVKGSGASR
jgi:nucleoside phosphorylase